MNKVIRSTEAELKDMITHGERSTAQIKATSAPGDKCTPKSSKGKDPK